MTGHDLNRPDDKAETRPKGTPTDPSQAGGAAPAPSSYDRSLESPVVNRAMTGREVKRK